MSVQTGRSDWLASIREDLTFVRRRLLVGVEALTDDDLGYRPVPNLMSPREQLIHVARAEHHWRSIARGVPSAFDDPAEPDAVGRADLIALLRRERRATSTWLESLGEWDLTREVRDPNGRRLNVAWVLNHLIRHDAHHAGQIILLGRLRHPDQPIPSRYDKILDSLCPRPG